MEKEKADAMEMAEKAHQERKTQACSKSNSINSIPFSIFLDGKTETFKYTLSDFQGIISKLVYPPATSNVLGKLREQMLTRVSAQRMLGMRKYLKVKF